MALASGTRLGAYEILEPLGRGGMGEVYRARDLRLDRDVAVKILPAALANNRDRAARFEREAKTLAGLNHPHIAHVYGFEDAPAQAGGGRALVMELVPGVTLARRLAQGPLPLDECVAIARQIADALDTAHESGVIHRDLKPANIKIRDDGTAKVLDFGLAKIVEPQAAARHGTPVEDSGTLTSPVETAAGIILGTAAYMSPEQARGKPVDKRGDIWAFGCVLYEMLTGRPAFVGETVTDVLATVVKNEPDLKAVSAPAHLRKLLSRCLQKDPKRRMRDIGDVRLELEEPLVPDEATNPPSPAARRRWWMVGAGVLVLAVGFATGAVWRSTRAAPSPIEWTGTRLGGPTVILNPRVSPDGQFVAFATVVDGLTQVAVMKPESGNWTVLTRDRSKGLVYNIGWAPDGSRIYYDRHLDTPRGVYSVPALGGEERLLLENAGGPQPLPDGTFIVERINAERQRQLHRFSPTNGRLEALPGIVRDLDAESQVRALPGGKSIAFLGRPLTGEQPQPSLYELDLDTQQVRHIGASLPIPVAGIGLVPSLTVNPDDGSILVAVRDGTLFRILKVRRGGAWEPHSLLFPSPGRIDASRGNTLFVSLVNRPTEILRLTGTNGRTERLAVGSSLVPGGIAPLGDSRFLMQSSAGSRTRILVAGPGKEPVPLVETDEDTRVPMTAVGDQHVALVIRSAAAEDIAVVAIANGRIIERFPAPPGLTALDSSPDGTTLYFAASGTISAVTLGGGTPRPIASGDSMTVDPDTGDVIAKLDEEGGARLVRIPAGGGPARPILLKGEFSLVGNPLVAGSIRKNQLLLPLSTVDSWNWHPGRIDLATGQVSKLPIDHDADVHFLTYGSDGVPIALALGFDSTLWKFEPRKPLDAR